MMSMPYLITDRLQTAATEKTGESTGRANAPVINLRRLIEYAIRAPSGHNLQPWKFRIGPDYIDLLLDPSRTLPVIDPVGREPIMSCGAALFHLRLAMRCQGYQDIVTLFPEVKEPEFIARIQVGIPLCATADEMRLFHAIPNRYTNRLSFYPRLLPASLSRDLVHAAQQEGADLHVIESATERTAITDLIGEGARVLASSPDFREEMQKWLQWRESYSATDDKVAHFSMEVGESLFYRGPLPSAVAPGDLLAAQEMRLAMDAQLLVVLSTQDDTPANWLAAGEALAHVLLRATVDGVCATFLNQPIQVRRLLPSLIASANVDGYPQLLLALGYAPTVVPAPRRPVWDVLISDVQKQIEQV